MKTSGISARLTDTVPDRSRRSAKRDKRSNDSSFFRVISRRRQRISNGQEGVLFQIKISDAHPPPPPSLLQKRVETLSAVRVSEMPCSDTFWEACISPAVWEPRGCGDLKIETTNTQPCSESITLRASLVYQSHPRLSRGTNEELVC
jgi:hypothetical protein